MYSCTAKIAFISKVHLSRFPPLEVERVSYVTTHVPENNMPNISIGSLVENPINLGYPDHKMRKSVIVVAAAQSSELLIL